MFRICLFFLVILAAAPLMGAVLYFDDLPLDLGPVPADYAGLTWHGDWSHWSGSAGTYEPHSAPNLAFFHAADSGVTFPTPVTVEGAWFSGPADVATVNFVLFLEGVQVATSATLALTPMPQYLATGYSGLVDDVQIYSTGLNWWTIDDITYDSAEVVPEPASGVMLALGLGGLAALAHRRKRHRRP
jgi:hypothetical protein